MQKSAMLLLFLGLFAKQIAFAQTGWIPYTWAAYFTKFQIPDDLEVEKADAAEFSARNNDFYVSIYPQKKEADAGKKVVLRSDMKKEQHKTQDLLGASQDNTELSFEQKIYRSELEEMLDDWRNQSGVSCTGKAEFIPDLNGYWGVYSECTKSGFPVLMLVIRDPDFPELLLYIWISYRESHYQTAIKILRSFKPS
jgi:hypothetical protein